LIEVEKFNPTKIGGSSPPQRCAGVRGKLRAESRAERKFVTEQERALNAHMLMSESRFRVMCVRTFQEALGAVRTELANLKLLRSKNNSKIKNKNEHNRQTESKTATAVMVASSLGKEGTLNASRRKGRPKHKALWEQAEKSRKQTENNKEPNLTLQKSNRKNNRKHQKAHRTRQKHIRKHTENIEYI